MGTSLRRAAAWLLASLLLTATAAAGSPAGLVYDITHFDVIPLDTQGVDFQKTAYKALFAYRDASLSDPGLASIRIINWQEALNHSFIVDVWNTPQALAQHLAQDHSVAFRFAVQNQPPNGICCIGSPIDDRQYRQVASIGLPWTSGKFPKTVGPKGAAWIVIYVDFLEQVLRDFRGNVGLHQLVRYGTASLGMNSGHLLDYTILQQVDRPNRYVLLEVWDTTDNYATWSAGKVTADFEAQLAPLLGSPLDQRVNALCGKTHDDNKGCVPP